MHRAPGHPGAVLPCLANRIETGERRQQRWMDVEHPVRISIEERSMKSPHESRQQHEVDAMPSQGFHPGSLVLDAGAKAPSRQDTRIDAEPIRTREDGGIRLIAEECGDAATENAASGGEGQGFEVGALSRSENGEVGNGGGQRHAAIYQCAGAAASGPRALIARSSAIGVAPGGADPHSMRRAPSGPISSHTAPSWSVRNTTALWV